MIKRVALAAAAALLAFGTAGAAQATLFGQTVNASLTSIFSGISLNQDSARVSVGGPEFVIDFGSGRGINIDIRDDLIDFRYNNVSNVGFSFDNFSITLSGLTWAPDPGVILGFTLEEVPDPDRPTAIGSFGPNTVDFTPDSLTLNIEGVWAGRDRLRVELITTHNQQLPEQPLPEPASLALFGVGLLGLGVAARRRHYLARLHD